MFTQRKHLYQTHVYQGPIRQRWSNLDWMQMAPSGCGSYTWIHCASGNVFCNFFDFSGLVEDADILERRHWDSSGTQLLLLSLKHLTYVTEIWRHFFRIFFRTFRIPGEKTDFERQGCGGKWWGLAGPKYNLPIFPRISHSTRPDQMGRKVAIVFIGALAKEIPK